jgi:chorismate lyase
LRWFSVKNKDHRQLTAHVTLRPWLLAHGSLTQQLRDHAGGEFSVVRVKESLQYPHHDEVKRLGISRAKTVWVREVLLFGDEQKPWVHARSVMPLKTLKGSGRRLKRLKNRSLGSLLFERGGLQAMPLVQQRKAREVVQTPAGWARRTTYLWHKKHILVQETFLPAFVQSLERMKKPIK